MRLDLLAPQEHVVEGLDHLKDHLTADLFLLHAGPFQVGFGQADGVAGAAAVVQGLFQPDPGRVKSVGLPVAGGAEKKGPELGREHVVLFRQVPGTVQVQARLGIILRLGLAHPLFRDADVLLGGQKLLVVLQGPLDALGQGQGLFHGRVVGPGRGREERRGQEEPAKGTGHGKEEWMFHGVWNGQRFFSRRRNSAI